METTGASLPLAYTPVCPLHLPQAKLLDPFFECIFVETAGVRRAFDVDDAEEHCLIRQASIENPRLADLLRKYTLDMTVGQYVPYHLSRSSRWKCSNNDIATLCQMMQAPSHLGLPWNGSFDALLSFVDSIKRYYGVTHCPLESILIGLANDSLATADGFYYYIAIAVVIPSIMSAITTSCLSLYNCNTMHIDHIAISCNDGKWTVHGADGLHMELALNSIPTPPSVPTPVLPKASTPSDFFHTHLMNVSFAADTVLARVRIAMPVLGGMATLPSLIVKWQQEEEPYFDVSVATAFKMANHIVHDCLGLVLPGLVLTEVAISATPRGNCRFVTAFYVPFVGSRERSPAITIQTTVSNHLLFGLMEHCKVNV